MTAPVTISIRADVKGLQRQLDRLANSQLPFATALALTALAKRVAASETAALSTVFENPTAFTKRAFGVLPARKATLTAVVFAKDIQAAYLAPSEQGTPQYLGKGRRIRTPVNINTNVSGNIPKGSIQRLLARPGVFLGTINGVNGLWQRVGSPKRAGRRTRRIAGNERPHKLRLLVAFTRPKPISTRLEYHQRARAVIAAGFDEEFSVAMRRALATVRL